MSKRHAPLIGAALGCALALSGAAPEDPQPQPGQRSESGSRLGVKRPPVSGGPARGANALGLRLLGELAADPAARGKNLILSPASVHDALALAQLGAAGETARELASALGLARPEELPRPVLIPSGPPSPDHAGPDAPAVAVDAANAAWIDQSLGLRPTYRDAARERFGAEAVPADFAQPDATRGAINEWVAGRTRGQIAELVGPDDLRDDTRFLLVNAVYFRGTWAIPFDAKKTIEAPFHAESGESVKIPTMRQTGTYRIFEGDGVALVELAYRGDAYRFQVVLPATPEGRLGDVPLSPEALDRWSRATQPRAVMLTLPKLKLRGGHGLKDPLVRLGLETPFSKRSDFSRLAREGKLLELSDVLHQATMDVDEQGTVATAATGVVGGARMMPRAFKVDRPFYFFLTRVEDGAILFAGRVVDPRPFLVNP